MADLPKGHTIQTKDFKKVVVGQKLGEGGQGAVYKVDFNGAEKALKWYSGKKIASPKKFYENLENNIKIGKPSDAFLWPEAITEKQGEAFGYIMDLRRPEYKDFSLFLLGREGFASATAMTKSAMYIVAGFRALHQKGYSYQDLNDGNFFIDPKTGKVLICDNDNVSASNTSGIAGKARYMAPEVVLGKKPGTQTDLFSLSLVLFFLWASGHALEGSASCVPCMNAKYEKRIYGENPIFIYDPNDNSNRPVQGIHKGPIRKWPSLPNYLREAFIKAFSKEVLTDPQKRIIEQEWLRIFIRMRGEIDECAACKEVFFADPVDPNQCPECKKSKNTYPMYIKTQKYNLAVHKRTKLFACHTEKNSDDFETQTGAVSVNGSDYMLKNMTKNPVYVNDAGTQTTIAPDGSFKLKKGTTINFGAVSVEVV